MKQHISIRKIIITAITSITIFFCVDFENKAVASANEYDFTSDKFQETAKQYLNIPYRWGGTTTSGFDCSGYVFKVFSDLGIELPRTSRTQYGVGVDVKKEDLQPGDLVFFNTLGNGVSHVGIYYGDGKFINSQSFKGVSITDINDPKYWGARFVGAKRVANVGELLQTTTGATGESAS
ncbi:C40 family peptidase [Ureibacillus manganicus]|uniref:C40 family peptidase n=1 Tax=Ureibacillus manganicus TaxID=1266064 RepID=UPI0009DEA641|nr:C40 family peptidase [Ureibacillus manganicus]